MAGTSVVNHLCGSKTPTTSWSRRPVNEPQVRSTSNAIIAFQQGKKASLTLAILGAVRPFIGAVFGLIVYALDRADLLPLKPPDTPDADLYYYAAIAFFAGFSERWAQSTLKNAIPLSAHSAPTTEPLTPPVRPDHLRTQQ
jgi:hypothetical protein